MDEGPLRLVREYVNTYEPETDLEALRTPADLELWLGHHGLLGRGEPVTADDLRRAVELREAIRELLVVNHDGEPTPVATPAAAVLSAAARRARLGAEFTPRGGYRLVPRAGGADGALGRLLNIIAVAMADGTWRRLKVCGNDTCRWAFFDASRPGTGKWCSMAVCGNRRKAQNWRARQPGRDQSLP